MSSTCTDPESFVRGGPPLTWFLVWWGEEWSKYHYLRAIIGPPAKCHLNGTSLACRLWPNIECWLGSFTILRGSGSVLLKKNPIFLWFFRGMGSGPPVPPLDPHMFYLFKQFGAMASSNLFWVQNIWNSCDSWKHFFFEKKNLKRSAAYGKSW